MAEARMHVRLADPGNPADDADLRRLLRETPMPGAIRVAYEQEPDYFAGARVAGDLVQTFVARPGGSGELAGMAVRAVKRAWVNGRPDTVGYLSGLRLTEAHRGGHLLARGYRFLRELHGDGRARLYLSTIVTENDAARRVLTSQRAELPAYHDIGAYRVLAIGRARNLPDGDVSVRSARAEDIPNVAEWIATHGPAKQFFPAYRAEDFGPGGLLHGVRPENVLLAFRGDALVGTAAVWDQSAYRQRVVHGYGGALAALRPPVNLAARTLGYPTLPRPGAPVASACLACVCVEDNAPHVFAPLLRAAVERAASGGRILLAGLHERDALLDVARRCRHVAYSSRAYVVCWEDGETAFRALDGRVPYLELGAL